MKIFKTFLESHKVTRQEALYYTKSVSTTFVVMSVLLIINFIVMNFLGKGTSSFNGNTKGLVAICAVSVCVGLIKALLQRTALAKKKGSE